MASEVASSALAEAIEQVAAGLDALRAAGVVPADREDARRIVREVEALGRKVDAAQIEVLDQLDRSSLHRYEGHASAKVMTRHVGRLSGAEANRRSQVMAALRELPLVAEAYREGRIGTCQVSLIARVHANPRVREQLVAADDAVARSAAHHSYRDFEKKLRDWERLADEDGARDRNQRSHENRDAKLVQDFDRSWGIRGGCASVDGAVLDEIFRTFIEAEFQADWAAARAAFGDAATAAHLDRTDGQRRFDALFAIFRKAADAWASEPGGARIDVDVLIDRATFERYAAQLLGAEPEPRTGPLPFDPDLPGDEPASDPEVPVERPDRFRCETADGRPLDPTEVVAHALCAHVRRVVLGSDSVVIDLGRRSRLFTGSALTAIRLSATHCYWPGCDVPVGGCQADHLSEWSDSGGRTDPGNGAPLCGRHNRLKHRHGFTVRRDERGCLHVHQPDGTEIT